MSKLAIKEILEKTLNNSNPFRDIPNGIKIKKKNRCILIPFLGSGSLAMGYKICDYFY